MDIELQNEIKEFLQEQFLELFPVIKELEDKTTNTVIPVYRIQLQEISFVVPLDNTELKTCIDYTFEVLDLFEALYKAQITYEKCMEISNSIEIPIVESLRAYHFFNHKEIKSKADIISLFNEIASFRRIGGAYWLLLKAPMFYNMLFSVLTVILKDFSDENLYIKCAFMIFRTILYLHDYKEKKEDETCLE